MRSPRTASTCISSAAACRSAAGCRAACAPCSCRRFACPTRASRRFATATSSRSTTRTATRRRDLLLAAYDSARPSAVLFETFPFGRRSLRFELFPLLERIDATRPRPLVIASIREILQVQQKPEREREMLEWAARWFDAIFVHGDPRFARFEDTFSFADERDAARALHGIRARRRCDRRGTRMRPATKSWSPPAAAAWASNCSRSRLRRSRTRASDT